LSICVAVRPHLTLGQDVSAEKTIALDALKRIQPPVRRASHLPRSVNSRARLRVAGLSRWRRSGSSSQIRGWTGEPQSTLSAAILARSGTRCWLMPGLALGAISTKAYVLINASPGRTLEVAEKLRAVPAIQNADAITGEYDIVAVCEVRDLSALGAVIVGEIQKVDGVFKTTTCLAIR
jgi:DNA-binding Lrp family transcriptional regulator